MSTHHHANGKRHVDEHATSGVAKKSKGNKSEAIPRNHSSSSSSSSSSEEYKDKYEYLTGMGAEMASEALPGALPKGQNTPQRCPYGLYAEQLSGTSFTTPRVFNQRSWLYRQMPTVRHLPFQQIDRGLIRSDFSDKSECIVNPNQLRWKPFPIPDLSEKKVDFVQGLATVCGAGSVETKAGLAVHIYACNTSMDHRFFCNSDGDMLIVPQQGALDIQTEFGYLYVPPDSICVIQRGIKFCVRVDGPTRGYVCEVFDGHLRLPDLGPLGANALAYPRDFQTPVAAYDGQGAATASAAHKATAVEWEYISKFTGQLFSTKQKQSPFDVVAWHGNYAPFKYNLRDFVTVNSVSVDHMDPSIFTVLTCPTAVPGVAALDFAIFPERWAVQERTFRPPYYHRNCMSEFMGNISGQYDAKPDGFQPGAASLHSMMMGHGPDAKSFEGASKEELKPVKMTGNLAFMFESTYYMRLTKWALEEAPVEKDYHKCWQGLKNHFDPQSK